MTADEFNALYPVGTPVVAYPGIRPEGKFAGWACTRLETKTRTPAWTLGHGEPVVSVEGYAGGICLTHVDVTAPAPTPMADLVARQREQLAADLEEMRTALLAKHHPEQAHDFLDADPDTAYPLPGVAHPKTETTGVTS